MKVVVPTIPLLKTPSAGTVPPPVSAMPTTPETTPTASVSPYPPPQAAPPVSPVPAAPTKPATASASPARARGVPSVPGAGNAPALPPIGTAAPPPTATATASQTPEAIEPGQLLVGWRSRQQFAAGTAILRSSYQIEPAANAAFIRLGLHMVLLQLGSSAEAEQLRRRMVADHPDWLIDRNTIYATSEGPRQYTRGLIAWPEEVPSRAAPTTIGVVDSTIERTPALAGARIVAHDFVAGSDDARTTRHGTAVTTLLVGRDAATGFRGVAEGARVAVAGVVVLRHDREETNAGLVISALDWLLGQNVSVINVSLGGQANRLLEAAIAVVTKRGVPVVAAAGNGGPDSPPVFPAAYANVVAVTAVDAAEAIYARANVGNYIWLAAPGVDVWVPDGPEQGRYVSGTSIAAPFAAGAIARVVQASPRLGTEEIRRRLCASARDLGAPGRDPVFGCGLLQVRRLIGLP